MGIGPEPQGSLELLSPEHEGVLRFRVARPDALAGKAAVVRLFGAASRGEDVPLEQRGGLLLDRGAILGHLEETVSAASGPVEFSVRLQDLRRFPSQLRFQAFWLADGESHPTDAVEIDLAD